MTLGELWDCFSDYPEILEYSLYPFFNKGKITDQIKMDDFIVNYEDNEVIEFEIRFDNPARLMIMLHTLDPVNPF